MFELRCTVRGCKQVLARVENGLRCANNHHFDQAKSGYWNLLQPQDRKSAKPGDSDEAVLARHRWLATGHMDGMLAMLRPWLASPEAGVDGPTRTLDLGCGEGTFGPALFGQHPKGYCGIDLSKKAMKMAARGWPEATWVLANADRFLPVTDESVHQVVSLFGRRPVEEIRRILVEGGNCIVAVPGEEDLIELREQVQETGQKRNRWEGIVEDMARVGLEMTDHVLWQHNVHLGLDGIRDALTMTYRAVRRSQQSRVDALQPMNVSLAADLLKFRST